MSHPLLPIEVEAQQVLDELWGERLIPFAMKVGKITKAPGKYIIRFHDSLIPAARVPLTEGNSFKYLLRAAVLARVPQKSLTLKNRSSSHFLD
jgi:hypothetical protein